MSTPSVYSVNCFVKIRVLVAHQCAFALCGAMGRSPGHPTIGGAMASNTVIKGNSKKGAFTGKAQLLNNTKSTSVSQTDAALAADASAAGGHYIAKAKSLWIGLQEHCQRFEESCTTRC